MDDVKKFDLVIIGTTQARFCFQEECCNIPAKNLSMNYSSFYSQKQSLEDNKNYINPDAKILLTIQYPIYLCNHDTNKTQLHFPEDWMMNYEEETKQNLYKNAFTPEQVQERIDKLITGWEREVYPFTVRNCSPDMNNGEMQKRLLKSLSLHQKIIDYSLTNGWKPVLVGLPYSKELTSNIPYEFVNDCFFKCAKSLSRSNDISFLDYSTDEEFSSIQNYLDVWYLNVPGREAFTKRLVEDLGV